MNDSRSGPLRILALGHEASRSGAVAIHLGWLQWAAARPERFAIRSFLARGGPLLEQWPTSIPAAVMGPLHRQLLKRGRFLPGAVRRWACPRAALAEADVVLVNTLALGWLLPCLGTKAPIMVHAHELASATTRLLHPGDGIWMGRHVSRWVTVSEAGRRHLVDGLGFKSQRVDVVKNFVWPRAGAATRPEARRSLAEAIGLPIDRPWIIAVGNIDPIKAPELFLETAARMVAVEPGCVFVWVGGGLDTTYGRALRHKPGAECVKFVGARTDVDVWLTAADMLVVTSVEESSSLVALEAMQAGTPVLAFSGIGGPDELLADGAGCLVPERSELAMARAIKQWLAFPEEANLSVAIARERVKRDADYERQCEAFATVLESAASGRPE